MCLSITSYTEKSVIAFEVTKVRCPKYARPDGQESTPPGLSTAY